MAAISHMEKLEKLYGRILLIRMQENPNTEILLIYIYPRNPVGITTKKNDDNRMGLAFMPSLVDPLNKQTQPTYDVKT